MSNELEKLEAAIAAHSTEEALQVKTKTNELIGPARTARRCVAGC